MVFGLEKKRSVQNEVFSNRSLFESSGLSSIFSSMPRAINLSARFQFNSRSAFSKDDLSNWWPISVLRNNGFIEKSKKECSYMACLFFFYTFYDGYYVNRVFGWDEHNNSTEKGTFEAEKMLCFVVDYTFNLQNHLWTRSSRTLASSI